MLKLLNSLILGKKEWNVGVQRNITFFGIWVLKKQLYVDNVELVKIVDIDKTTECCGPT